MADIQNALYLDAFYPEESLKIIGIEQQENKIVVKMKSITKNCAC